MKTWICLSCPQGFRRQRWVLRARSLLCFCFSACASLTFPMRRLYQEHSPLVCSILVISLSQSTSEPHRLLNKTCCICTGGVVSSGRLVHISPPRPLDDGLLCNR